MKRTTITACAALILLSCNNSSENKTTTDTTAKKDTSTMVQSSTTISMPDSATMMKNWQAYMTPGEVHKMMASWSGAWNEEVSTWMSPDAPASKSTGVATNKMILGGRYQVTEHKGSMMGQPFEGMGTMGYDNIKKVFVSTWEDNMGTGIMSMEGPWDAATKSATLKGKVVDPTMQKEVDVKEVFKVIDDNTQILEMYGAGPDGKEMKMMEIKFTRKK